MFTIIKNPIKTILLGTISALFLTSCTTMENQNKTAPIWVMDADAVYSEQDFLSAVGYASERAAAEAEAVANLSKILRQKVETSSFASQVFENNLEDQSQSYESTVKTSSLIDEITGIEIQEVWTSNDNTTYALALLNRKEVGNYYYNKVTENEDAINALLNVMIDNEATFEGLSSAQKALQIALENETYLELLSVINPSIFKNIDLAYKSANAISVLIELEKEKIYVGVFISDDIDTRVTAALSSVFKNAGYKSQILTSFAETSPSMPYILYGELLISPFSMTSSQNNKYVRFTLNTELVDMKGKTSFPWSISGREAHLTETEAAQRAIRTIEEKIEKEFSQEVKELLY